MSDTYLNFMGKLIKLIDQNDGTYAFATELTPGAVNIGKITIDEGNKYAGQVGVVLAKGVATVGGLNTLLDNTKNFPAALFAGKYLKVNIDGIEYVREILTNVDDGIAFRDIFAAVSAVNVYGEASGGQVTTVAPAGTEGNEYTIEFVAPVQNGVVTSASLTDKRITVILGTGNDGVPASAVIGTGTNGTVHIAHDNVGVAGNSYSVEVVEGEGLDVPMSVAFSDATKKIVVTLGTDAAGDLDALKNMALLIATEINIQVAGSEDPMTATSSGDGSTALITAEAEKPLMGGIDPSIIATGADVAAAINTIEGFSATMTGSGGAVAAGQGTFSGGLDAIVVPALAEYEIIDFGVADTSDSSSAGNAELLERTAVNWDGTKESDYVVVPLGSGREVLITVINSALQLVAIDVTLEHEVAPGEYISYMDAAGNPVKWTVAASGGKGVFGVIQGFPMFRGGRVVLTGTSAPTNGETTSVQVQEV